ncbi:MAG: hypothetical protein AAF542_09425 [Pseudomonadota bacterium]
MADIISFDKKRRVAQAKKAKDNTLCANGHHKWRIIDKQVFDSKKGRLVTRYECNRCGKLKVKAL